MAVLFDSREGKGKADCGVMGLAVMGKNLALNISDHGYTVSVCNRTYQKTEDLIQRHPDKRIIGCQSTQDWVASMKRPRRALLMVQAGVAVDKCIEGLIPLLEPGDIIIDGGNSHFGDSERRAKFCSERKILFVGMGISGGEEGARRGPSLMPGGDASAWPHLKEILSNISARHDGEPCCDWIGHGGSGHYVKMVHNGIEYGDMQIICEVYDLLRRGLGLEVPDIAELFEIWNQEDWNQGKLKSYLIEITSQILRKKDAQGWWIDRVLDVAGQKGTGAWTVEAACGQGVALPMIAEALFARSLSTQRGIRQKMESLFPAKSTGKDRESSPVQTTALASALYGAKISSYAQGISLLMDASRAYEWNLNMSSIARLWREGCIIRSTLLDRISQAYERNPHLEHLFLDPFFRGELDESEREWRSSVLFGIREGIPLPALSSSLSFFDGIRRAQLPIQLLQAQRDAFGAHTYERTDRPEGEKFHSEWLS